MPEQFEKTSDQILSPRLYRNQAPEERRRQRRARLVDAAVDMFARRGYHATSVDALCAAAGVSTRNFYEEFANKEAVMIDLYETLNQRALQAATQALKIHQDSPLRERIAAGLSGYLGTVTADSRWARVVLIESMTVSAAVEARRRATLEAFQALVTWEGQRLADDGAIPARDLTMVAVGAVGAVRELAIHAVTHDDVDHDALVVEATNLILGGLAPS